MSASPSSNRALVIAAVMIGMVMVAFEATIVSTAMPQIVAELGGLPLYSWVFSAFLLTQTALTVVFGKLADIYGRKPMMLVGTGIFLLGSLLAGFAWSMPAMILFRLIQGVGAGAIQPVAMTIVGDLYPAHERGKIQGYLASVWAVSAVLGPMLGGLIIHRLSWAWIFWINLPLGALSALGFVLFLHEQRRERRASVDVAGAGLFALAIAALMAMLTDDGGARPWLLPAAAAFVLCAVLFVIQERRAAEPMLSFSLWSHRPIALANGATLLSGMALMGVTTFLPMYVQGVLHRSPIVAGLALTMVMLGWPVGATLSARWFMRLGLKPIMLAGSVLIPLGAAAFALLGGGSSPLLAGAGSLVMGFGMGLLSTTSLVLVQEQVDWSQRGSATASNLFSRNLGSTLGAAVLGAVLNASLAGTPGVGQVSSERLRRLLETPPDGSAGDPILHAALQLALHHTFLAMLAITVLVVPLIVWLPAVAIGRARAQENP